MYIWILISVISLVLITLGFYRINIPRDPGKEGFEDLEAKIAYDNVNHWLLFKYFRYIVLRKLKSMHQRGTVLDAGCGPGYLAFSIGRKYLKSKVIGVDISEEILRIAVYNRSIYRTENVQFVKADVARLPFSSESIDLITSTLSLHHWSHRDEAMVEFHRILKPGGKILIFDLRRDEPLLVYYLGHFIQNFLSPSPIRKVNGGIGSIWSSYKPDEMALFPASKLFRKWKVEKGWAWAYIRGEK